MITNLAEQRIVREVDRLFSENPPQYGQQCVNPVTGWGYFGGSDPIEPQKEVACRALGAREDFKLHGPRDCQPLPLSGIEIENLKYSFNNKHEPDLLNHIVSCFAYSRRAHNDWDDGHPNFEDFACGVMAAIEQLGRRPNFRGELCLFGIFQPDEILRLKERFPPRPLKGFEPSGFYWQRPAPDVDCEPRGQAAKKSGVREASGVTDPGTNSMGNELLFPSGSKEFPETAEDKWYSETNTFNATTNPVELEDKPVNAKPIATHPSVPVALIDESIKIPEPVRRALELANSFYKKEPAPKNNVLPFTTATPAAAVTSLPLTDDLETRIKKILAGPPPGRVGWIADELKVNFADVRHRRWLYSTYLIRGENTFVASPGGVGKTALTMAVAVEIATGTELLGEKIFGGSLKVLYINGEDGRDEIERRVLALCLAHAKKIAVQPPERLYVLGADDARVQRLSFLTMEKTVAIVDRSGFGVLESALEALHPDLLILDPLVAFCGGGNMNDNAMMALVSRELKRLAAKFDCAVLIVHHTRKGTKGSNSAGEAEDISGAAAIVNLARRAVMPVPMTKEEANTFGVLPSERYRYFKLVDAKSNLAPRSDDSPWYRLHSVELPNPELPIYRHGDNVQAVERVNLPLLKSAATTADDQKIRRAILDLVDHGKIIEGQPYPYSPSEAGASKERALLDDAMAAVGNATAPRQWRPDDLKAVTERAIATMKTEGWLAVKVMKELVSKPGRFRGGRGLTVNWALTPWPKASADDATGGDAMVLG